MRRPEISRFSFVMMQALMVYALLMPFNHAEASATVGTVILKGVRNYGNIPILLNVIAYGAAFLLALIGINKIRQHSDRPDQVPFTHAAWHLVGAAFLASLPYFIGMILRSMDLDIASGATKGATTITLNTTGTVSLDVMMNRLIQDIRGPVNFLIWSLGVVLGMFFMLSGIIRLSRGAAQDGPRGSLGSGTMGRIIIGAILFSVAASTDAFTSTLFGGSVVQFKGMTISGVDAATLDRANQAMAAILIFVQILGFFAFIRGFLMLRALADGNNSVSTAAAATHILGGSVAINISSILSAFQNTFCGADVGCKIIKF